MAVKHKKALLVTNGHKCNKWSVGKGRTQKITALEPPQRADEILKKSKTRDWLNVFDARAGDISLSGIFIWVGRSVPSEFKGKHFV